MRSFFMTPRRKPPRRLRLGLPDRHEFLQATAGLARIAAGGQTAEDVPPLISSQTLRPCSFDEVLQRSILRAADPNAVFPARIANRVAAAFRRIVGSTDPVVRLRVGDDERVVFEDPDAAGAPEMRPRVDNVHVFVEDLHAVVRAIGDEKPPLRVERETVWPQELAGLPAVPAELLDELPVPCEPDQTIAVLLRVRRTRPVAVGDQDVSVDRKSVV